MSDAVIPQAGEIWYHFKYPQGCGDDRPYKIIGIAYDTTSEITYVVYQPLYANDLMDEQSKNGVMYFVRPLSEWSDLRQNKTGELVPRFTKLDSTY